jgi:uncharacterized membrane protein HdeD (DUF308 family)
MLGLSRPHSDSIWRVRAASGVVVLVLAILSIVSPLATALTIGAGEPVEWVTVVLTLLAVAAGIVLVCTYPAERREIANRVVRDEEERPADSP